MFDRRRRRRLAANGCLLAVALAAGCAAPPPKVIERPLPVATRAYLLAPENGYSGRLDPERARQLAAAFARLVNASDRAGAVAVASRLLGEDPALAPAAVLLAMSEVASGALGEAIARLRPIASREPSYSACQLLLGHALELTGELPEAVTAYDAAAVAAPIAVERSRAIRPRAGEIALARLDEALRLGETDRAATWLAWLERALPRERAAVEGRRRWARATGDLKGELAAVRSLAADAAQDRGLQVRLGELELAVGDPGRGLALFEQWAQNEPRNPEALEALARARFEWRLRTLPAQVQTAAARPALTRADLAVLLYWVVPGVRTGRPAATRVASDSLDHAAREEIVRVVNFGLLTVDETLHRFEPQRGATFSEATTAVARALARFGSRARCAVGQEWSDERALDRAASCELLRRCRVVGADEECSARPISGRAALDLLRAALEAMGELGR